MTQTSFYVCLTYSDLRKKLQHMKIKDAGDNNEHQRGISDYEKAMLSSPDNFKRTGLHALQASIVLFRSVHAPTK